MDTHLKLIEAYFQEWTERLRRARKLMNDPECHLEGILVLSCYIGAFARLRYPSESDNTAYKDVVLKYSGKESFYANIDLLFLYQWPRSAFHHPKLTNHQELVTCLTTAFGDEATLKAKDQVRYQPPGDVLNAIQAHPFKGLDMTNVRSNLPLFSNLEILYRVVRCSAVHEYTFPLVNEVYYPETNERGFAPNHAITGEVIFQTCSNILDVFRTECLQNGRFPFQLWT